jgi:phosphoribosyl 1,2-cyclic phosphodiesterase
VNAIIGFAKFEVGALKITPYPVPHDALEPSQFTLADGQSKLGVLTDAGAVTEHMFENLRDCDALVLEFNHDVDLLLKSSYPAPLKKRISGGFGHLSNTAAKEFLKKLINPKLKFVLAAHLSETNNSQDLVRGLLSEILDESKIAFAIANQHDGSGWIEIN